MVFPQNPLHDILMFAFMLSMICLFFPFFGAKSAIFVHNPNLR